MTDTEINRLVQQEMHDSKIRMEERQKAEQERQRAEVEGKRQMQLLRAEIEQLARTEIAKHFTKDTVREKFGFEIENNPGLWAKKQLQKKSAMGEDDGTRGGYPAKVAFWNSVLGVPVTACIRPTATVIQTDARETLLPLWDLTTPQGVGSPSFLAGVSLAWFAENAQPGENAEPLARQVSMVTNLLGAWGLASNPWLADACSGTIEPWLNLLFARALAYFEDKAFLRGSGEGEPQGILTSGATLAVNRAYTSQFGPVDASNMLSKLLPSSFGNSIWIMSPSCLPQLTSFPAWVPNGEMRLHGRPIIVTDLASNLGAIGDVMLIDPSWYCIADNVPKAEQAAGIKRRLEFMVSSEASQTIFIQNQTAFLLAQRLDGRPLISAPITLQDGTSTVSPFVVLN